MVKAEVRRLVRASRHKSLTRTGVLGDEGDDDDAKR